VTGGCYGAGMAISLSEATLRLLDGRNYAVLATVNRDGSPQTSAMWIGRDGSDVLFSTVAGRVKHNNMLRDPRVRVPTPHSPPPHNSGARRGGVPLAPPPPPRLHLQLAEKYDQDPGEDAPGAARVLVRMAVERATGYAA